jgi:hypothetical protein
MGLKIKQGKDTVWIRKSQQQSMCIADEVNPDDVPF